MMISSLLSFNARLTASLIIRIYEKAHTQKITLREGVGNAVPPQL